MSGQIFVRAVRRGHETDIEAVTLKRSPRKHLRPSQQPGITEKRFKKLGETARRVGKIVHPLVVIADLRRGSLVSLDKYLAKHRGIPDREVALELRKLITGTIARSRYRIVAVEHPDTPADAGGRPPIDEVGPSDRDLQIASRYEEFLAVEGKAWLAMERVRDLFELSEPTIRRAVRRVARARELRAARDSDRKQQAHSIENRNVALAKLRAARAKDST
ncbi:hypothetical protein [Sphingobium sp. R-7]|uniref:hypothetical protein n=1 Tax=Sphingobium sp. R-7 TaxID=3375449 RepID=UPI00398A5EAF